MGVAYYIVLNNEEPGFDTFVDGKAIVKEIDALNSISAILGIHSFEDFLVMSSEDLEDLVGEDIDIPDQNASWLGTEDGIKFISKLKEHIKANPKCVANQSAIIDELSEYEIVLQKADSIGAKWCLNIDF
jgi:hypothetical protein